MIKGSTVKELVSAAEAPVVSRCLGNMYLGFFLLYDRYFVRSLVSSIIAKES